MRRSTLGRADGGLCALDDRRQGAVAARSRRRRPQHLVDAQRSALRKRAAARGLPSFACLTLKEVRVPLFAKVPACVRRTEELSAGTKFVDEPEGQCLLVYYERTLQVTQPTDDLSADDKLRKRAGHT